jgi:hypothetical protein
MVSFLQVVQPKVSMHSLLSQACCVLQSINQSIIFGENILLWRCSLRNFHQPSIFSSLENEGIQSLVYIGFEVLTWTSMKIYIFWDVAPCTSVKFNRRFEEPRRLRFQGSK